MSTKANTLLANLLIGKTKPAVKVVELNKNIDFDNPTEIISMVVNELNGDPIYGKDEFEAYVIDDNIVAWNVAHHKFGAGVIIANMETDCGQLIGLPKLKGDVKTYKTILERSLTNHTDIIEKPTTGSTESSKAILAKLTNAKEVEVKLDYDGQVYLSFDNYLVNLNKKTITTYLNL